MKNTIQNLICFATACLIFTLGATGELHPFAARAGVAIVVTVWAFLALLPYHKEGNK